MSPTSYRVPLLVSLLVLVLGVSGLAGWELNITALKSVLPGLVAMKPNTALGLILCGISLALLSREKVATITRFSIVVAAIFLIALGALTLSEELFGWDWGIDQWLFRIQDSATNKIHPARFSPSTAFCFMLAGGALLIASRRVERPWRLPILASLSVTIMTVGVLALWGYASAVLFQLSLWNYTGMALHTATGFLLLGFGLLMLARSEGGLTWSLDRRMTGGFAIGILALLMATAVSYNFINILFDGAKWVNHTQEVLKEIEKVKGGMAALESSQRGYIITGDEPMLGQRKEIKAAVQEDLEAIRRLTVDNPLQQHRLDELDPLIVSRTDFGEQTILTRRQKGFPAAEQMLATGTGIRLTENINHRLTAMSDTEYTLLAQRQNISTLASTTTFLLLPLGVYVSLTLLFLELFFLNAGIAEQKEGQAAAAKLAAIVNSSNDAIIGKDLNSIITSWNSGAEKLFGYSAKEMIGSPITRLIPFDRKQEELEIIERVKQGEVVEHFETQRVTRQGGLVDIAVTVSPIRDQSGQIIGASKVARDISERKRTQKVLHGERDFISAVVDTVGSLVVVLDRQARIIRFNRACERLTGYSFAEVKGQNLIDLLIMPEERSTTSEEFKNLCAGQFPNIFENHWRNRDGSPRVIAWSNTALVDAKGEVEYVIGTGTDITERKRAEKEIQELNIRLEQRVAERTVELEAANKELEAFSYSVSHDLRAPLRAVDGFSQAVLEDYGPQLPEEGRRYLQTIREGAQRMGALIDDLLTFSRLSRSPLNKKAIDFGHLVRHVLEESVPQQKGRQVNIHLGELPSCQGDLALLNQVWVNLISNALKYTRHRVPAVIEIGCDSAGGENHYFVRDNGAGFDMRYVHKLFGVFQRLHRVEDFEGTGVGLAIVQRIIHRHGGRIWAEAAIDRGATFYFTLKPT